MDFASSKIRIIISKNPQIADIILSIMSINSKILDITPSRANAMFKHRRTINVLLFISLVYMKYKNSENCKIKKILLRFLYMSSIVKHYCSIVKNYYFCRGLNISLISIPSSRSQQHCNL